MQAYANGMIPPPPSARIMDVISSNTKAGSSGGGMPGVPCVPNMTDPPFYGTESIFKNVEVRNEFDSLTRDHASIISLGENYGKFDR